MVKKTRFSIKSVIAVMLALLTITLVGCAKDADNGSKNKKSVYLLSEVSLSLEVGQNKLVEVLRRDGKQVEETATWEILNSKVAVVENGVVTALLPGETKITVSIGEEEMSLTVKVTNTMNAVATLELDNLFPIEGKYELNLLKGSSLTLEPVVKLDGEVKSDAVVMVTTEDAGVSIAGATLTAEQACVGAVVKVSCNYLNQELLIEIIVNVAE